MVYTSGERVKEIVRNVENLIALIIQDIKRKKWTFDALDFIVLINSLKGIYIEKLKN